MRLESVNELVNLPGRALENAHGTDLLRRDPAGMKRRVTGVQCKVRLACRSTMTRWVPALAHLVASFAVPMSVAGGPHVTDVQIVTPHVARYEKFEVQFSLATPASNPYFPYDSSPPQGIQPGIGVSVDGLFSNDAWQTTLVQPAFLFQPYTGTIVGGRDHYTPDGAPGWSVRFAPPTAGVWRFRIRVRDAFGTSVYPATSLPAMSFSVAPTSSNPYVQRGFLRVSKSDSRYFEFDDGTPFIGVGFNDGFSSAAEAEMKMEGMEAGRVNFLRVWLSSASINGSQWSAWSSHSLPYDGYLPAASLETEATHNGSDVAWELDAANPCLFTDWAQGGIPVEPNTDYTVSVRFRVSGLTGPARAGDWGFAVKQAGWLGTSCDQPDDGRMIIGPIRSTDGWTTLTGRYTTSPGQMWLDYLYMSRENATSGNVYVDEVRVWKTSDPDQVNLLREPEANSHLIFDPMASFRWDSIIDSAAEHGVYLKLVLDEKNEWIRNRVGLDGRMTKEPSNDNFYAAPDTKVRWVEEAWWRYVIARWGYSTAIHSFEYVNEGDPFNGHHYEAANTMAAYFHAQDPSGHMVTTSFWHSFPNAEFWSNPAYSDIDYADVHAYTTTGWGPTAAFVPPQHLEMTSANVHSGDSSVHWAAKDDGHVSITPPGLVIRGPGEWTVRYWMKADDFSATCPGESTGGRQRVRWILDGGTFWGGREGVVPSNRNGNETLCTSPGGTFGWTQFDSPTDKDGHTIALAQRLVLTDSQPHMIGLQIENDGGVTGDVWIDDVELVSPAGDVVPIIGRFEATPMADDLAWFNASYSELYGGNSPVGAAKPLIRGESGVVDPQTGEWDRELLRDLEGVWLHNSVWGQLNSGGMYDLPWWSSETIPANLYRHYLTYRNFMDGIPVSSGRYRDAGATASNPYLRVWGQVDSTNGRAHVWIQNSLHTWKRVMEGPGIPALDGTITVPDLVCDVYQLEWWDTYKTKDPVYLTQKMVGPRDPLVFSLPAALTSDVALKIHCLPEDASR